ncbi:hypothetical protein ABIA30_005407 [Mycobacterium sp. MAA66]|uniref:hypothetical protein n=1 Tax=Mycobacterium sp. MAA66 TaxID=3156297 RepID=UPI003518EB9C
MWIRTDLLPWAARGFIQTTIHDAAKHGSVVFGVDRRAASGQLVGVKSVSPHGLSGVTPLERENLASGWQRTPLVEDLMRGGFDSRARHRQPRDWPQLQEG